jgi:hypothetical protein
VQVNPLGLPQWKTSYIMLDAPMEADGLLATVYIDTTGFTGGTFELRVGSTIEGSWVGAMSTTFVTVPVEITNGTITIGSGMAAMGGGEGGEGSTGGAASYGFLEVDLGPGVHAAGFDAADFEFYVSAEGKEWVDASEVVAVSVSLGAGEKGGDLILIQFIAEPPAEFAYFRFAVLPNALAELDEYTTLDFDLKMWKRL